MKKYRVKASSIRAFQLNQSHTLTVVHQYGGMTTYKTVHEEKEIFFDASARVCFGDYVMIVGGAVNYHCPKVQFEHKWEKVA